MTRWHKRDLTGQILKSSVQRSGSDEWEVIELPAILPSGSALWPQFWKLEELEKLRAELPTSKWQAQYQQDPTSEEGAIIKREWWKAWEYDEPPQCDFIIQSWDTAFLKSQRSDYSACTTWGVFYKEGDDGRFQPNLILLSAFKDRMEFPELKKFALDYYKKWQPDALIVEGKAAGMPLIFEMRAVGIPVQEYTPSRGNDKIARVNAVADLFASGIVWRPEKRFAEEVVEEFASFPAGDHDDLVDSATQALIRFRQGGFLPLDTDDDGEEDFMPIKADYY
jgi:predicted phage terminase large subunit-like protein